VGRGGGGCCEDKYTEGARGYREKGYKERKKKELVFRFL
jgi:hypothetical protein